MNIRTILHSPSRIAAGAAVAGLLFAACGSTSDSEGAHTAAPQRHQAAPATGSPSLSGIPGDVQVSKDDAGNAVVTVAPYISFLAGLAAD